MPNKTVMFLILCSVSVKLGAQVSAVMEQESTKLKQISRSWTGSKIWHVITEYEYDSLGRISKVSTPKYDVYTGEGKITGAVNYKIYFYNADNQLEEIKNYGSITCQGYKLAKEATYKYSYDKNGNKLKEVSEYIMADSIYYWVGDNKIGYSQNIIDSTLYFYDDKNRLIREEKYEGEHGPFVGKLMYTHDYEYEYDDQGKLVAETCYSGEWKRFKHIFEKGLKVKTENFRGQSKNISNETHYFYDEKGNRIYLESREMSSFSSLLPFDLKYEY